MLWRRGGLGPLHIGTPVSVSVSGREPWEVLMLSQVDAAFPSILYPRGEGVFLGYCWVPVFGPMPSETSLLYFPLDSRVRFPGVSGPLMGTFPVLCL